MEDPWINIWVDLLAVDQEHSSGRRDSSMKLYFNGGPSRYLLSWLRF